MPEELRAQARDLLESYRRDLGIERDLAVMVAESARAFLPTEHWSEIEALAINLDVPVINVMIRNIYYDALKVAIGCSAFAVDTDTGVLHARNLDWWTTDSAFSGIAKGRFAVTLNAVVSFDPPQPALLSTRQSPS